MRRGLLISYIAIIVSSIIMGRRRVSTAACIVGAALLSLSFANANDIDSPPIVDGGLRRKRLFNHQYKSETREQVILEPPPQQEDNEILPLTNIYRAGDIANNQDVGDELAHKFFLSPTHKNALDDIDITQLIMEMNFEGGGSMSFIQTLSPTPPPTVSPTKSPSISPTVSESIKTLKYLVIICIISYLTSSFQCIYYRIRQQRIQQSHQPTQHTLHQHPLHQH